MFENVQKKHQCMLAIGLSLFSAVMFYLGDFYAMVIICLLLGTPGATTMVLEKA